MENRLLRKGLVVGIILLFVGASVISGYVSSKSYQPSTKADPRDGLVGYWSFNEGSGDIAHDSSGYGNNGTIYGETQWVDGILGNALSFDGVDDWIDCGNDESLNPSTAITLAAWYKPTTSWYGAGTDPIIDKSYDNTSSVSYQYHLGVCGNLFPDIKPLSLTFDIDAGGNYYSTNTPANTLSFNHWSFIVGLYDGSIMKLYVDGVLISSEMASGSLSNYGYNLSIAKYNVNGEEIFLPGVIDEIRMYNLALTEDEILDLYKPSMVYVDDDFNSSTPGWGYDHFSSIQDGIDAVDVVGTVFVFNGTYTEELGPNLENVRIEKSLNLIGENRETTIINCPIGETGVWIKPDLSDIKISGFTVIGNHQESIGIYANWNCDDVIIEDCIVHTFSEGISCRFGCSNIMIRNCVSYDNNREGGVTLMETDYDNVEISNCTCHSNTYGIKINSAMDGLFFHNNLFNNTVNAYDIGSNFWYNSDINEGNFYDDYTGEDNNGDGIGDKPYNISGGNNQDLYPLMHPYEQYYILNISLDNHEVNESTPFYVNVKTLAGTVVPDAQVLFNGEIISTDPNGIAAFFTPEVTEDAVFPIVASKAGYTSDNDTILVKNVPEELIRSFIFGKYTNLTEESGYITIEAVNLWLIRFNPFKIYHFTLQYGDEEKVTYLRDTAKVILMPRFILGFIEVR